MLELLRRWGTAQAQGMSVEFVDERRQLPIVYRNTIANMMAEAEALERHLRARRDHVGVVSREGHQRERSAVSGRSDQPGDDARYDLEDAIDLDDVAADDREAVQPGNAHPAEEVARERLHVRQGADRLVHERQLRRSAAGGARRARRARPRRRSRGDVDSSCFPGSGGVARQIERHDPRLAGESIADVFRSVGARDPPIVVRPLLRPGP